MTDTVTNTSQLRDYLEAIPSPAVQHVLERGRSYRIARNEELDFGEAKNCYGNAALVALFDDRYRYVEGWTIGIIPIRHAWVERISDGAAIDVTLRFGSDTCGHCDGEGRRPLDSHADCDLCDGDGEEYGCEADQLCALINGVDAGCHGTGKTDLNLDWDPDREYIGVAVNADTLSHVLHQTGTYGVLDKPLYYDLTEA